MRKTIVLILSSILISTSLFAISDYEQGYLDGYESCKKGLENEVQIKLDEAKANSSTLANWKINYYVDEFGDATDNGFIAYAEVLEGVFSNSATTNSQLLGVFLIDDSAAIKLYEYGSSEVKGNSRSPDEYNIAIKCNGKKYNFTAKNYNDRLFIYPYEEFIKMLKIEKPITISIVEKSKYGHPSSYLLKDIDTVGFNNAYNQLFNK
jgi:hypothetical protein